MEAPRPIGYKSTCPTCGAMHDEVIKRLRGIIFTVPTPIEHDHLIALMYRQRCSWDEIMKQHGLTKVVLKPVPGTESPFFCPICLPAAIVERKKELKKLAITKDQLGLF